MRARAFLVMRLFLMAAFLPVLAGCAFPDGDEPLTRGDIQRGDPISQPTIAWADLSLATVRPGMMIQTEARDCLANYLFVRPDNGGVFIGTTAYCVRDLAIGSAALVGSDTDIAILVYNSQQTMADAGETDSAALNYNDLALFHLDRTTIRRANPTLPIVGGPHGITDGDALALGSRLRAFSPSDTVAETPAWHEAVLAGRESGWALLTYQAPPTIPGSIGGAAIDERGDAAGIVVSLGVMPNPGANAVARLDALLAYARDQGNMPIELATPP